MLAFCDSRAVDADGAPLWPDHKAYYAELAEADNGALAADLVLPAAEFLRRFMAERNAILNASAVLFRRDALLAALDRCGRDLASYQVAGDWRLYAEMMMAGGSVAYVAEPLNTHRRHAASATGRLDPARHVDEVARVQALIAAHMGDPALPGTAARLPRAHRRAARGGRRRALNLAALLLAVARARPDAPALTGDGRILRWGELAARVQALAGGMRARGIAPGARVVLCMENGPEAVEALLAAWCAGLCAVPVNARLHRREIEHIAEACSAALVVTTPGLADSLAGLPGLIVAPGTEWDGLLRADPAPPYPSEPSDPAWIFYTSGTTGRPKGAILSHRNLLFMAHAYYADVAWVEPGETMLHAAPLSHGAGLFMLPHMLRGGHQVVLPGFDPDAVADTVNQHRRTSFFAAPTMLARLVAHPAGSASTRGASARSATAAARCMRPTWSGRSRCSGRACSSSTARARRP